MTKKFFEDWKRRRSMTDKVDFNYQYEINGIIYCCYSSHNIDLDTLQFHDDSVSFITEVSSWNVDGNRSTFRKVETKRITVHRTNIRTVKFRKVL